MPSWRAKKVFLVCHCVLLGSQKSSLKLRMMSGLSLYNWMRAMFLPRHVRVPKPNAIMYLSIWFARSWSSQRSGLNESASSPKIFLSCCTTAALQPTMQPPGMNFPQSVMPSLGTTRGNAEIHIGCQKLIGSQYVTADLQS